MLLSWMGYWNLHPEVYDKVVALYKRFFWITMLLRPH